jgi:hypothetical protein
MFASLRANLADGELPACLKRYTPYALGLFLPFDGILVRRLARAGCFTVVRLRHNPTAKQEAADLEYLHVRDYVHMWGLAMIIYHRDRKISYMTLPTHGWCSW